jgi:hypothetical protein
MKRKDRKEAKSAKAFWVISLQFFASLPLCVKVFRSTESANPHLGAPE